MDLSMAVMIEAPWLKHIAGYRQPDKKSIADRTPGHNNKGSLIH